MLKKGNRKGISLIIVIFAVLLFAGLGWTLMSMQSQEVASNMRAFDTEKALYIAEAGAQYGMERFTLNSAWRTSAGDTCTDWELHTFGGGQYRLCCRNPAAGESGEAVIESEGYVPSYAQYLAKRKVMLCLSQSGLSRAVQVRYLLDWSGASSRNPLIYGDVGVRNAYSDNLHDGYEGNGNAVHNQSADVDPVQETLKPPGAGSRDLLTDDASFPILNTAKIEDQFANNVHTPPRGAELTDIQTSGGKSTLTFSQNIFNAVPQSQFAGQAMRNTTMGSWQSGSWGVIEEVLSANSCRLATAVAWEDRDADAEGKGDNVGLAPKIASIIIAGSGGNWGSNPRRTYEITISCNVPFTEGNVLRNFSSEERNARQKTWNYRDWGEITSVSTTSSTTTIRVELDSSVASAPGWQANDWIGEAKRFAGNNNNQVWFIKSDMLFDLRSSNANCNESTFFAEGDVGLVGAQSLTVKARNKMSANPTLPNLSSVNGSIYSYSNMTAGCRVFQGVVYSYNGDLTFDSINGTSLFAYNATFTGYLNLNFVDWSKYVDDDGFYAGASSFLWSEEQ